MKQGTVYYQQAGLQQWPKTRHIALLKMIIIVKGKKSQIQLCIVFISQSASINEKKKMQIWPFCLNNQAPADILKAGWHNRSHSISTLTWLAEHKISKWEFKWKIIKFKNEK